MIDVFHGLSGQFRRDVCLLHGGKGRDARQRTLQLADVRVDAAGDEADDVVGDLDIFKDGLFLKQTNIF